MTLHHITGWHQVNGCVHWEKRPGECERLQSTLFPRITGLEKGFYLDTRASEWYQLQGICLFLFLFFILFLSKCKHHMPFREERGLAIAMVNCPGPVHLGSWHRDQPEMDNSCLQNNRRWAQPVFYSRKCLPHIFHFHPVKQNKRQKTLTVFPAQSDCVCGGEVGGSRQGIKYN